MTQTQEEQKGYAIVSQYTDGYVGISALFGTGRGINSYDTQVEDAISSRDVETAYGFPNLTFQDILDFRALRNGEKDGNTKGPLSLMEILKTSYSDKRIK
jgi:hypothetical protein